MRFYISQKLSHSSFDKQLKELWPLVLCLYLVVIAGAMEATISKLMCQWPGTKFAWYTGFQGPILDSEEAAKRCKETYRVLMEEIAPKWGTPVCDLTRCLGLNTFMPGNRELLTNGDGQHCTTPGYAAWETAIDNFLKLL